MKRKQAKAAKDRSYIDLATYYLHVGKMGSICRGSVFCFGKFPEHKPRLGLASSFWKVGLPGRRGRSVWMVGLEGRRGRSTSAWKVEVEGPCGRSAWEVDLDSGNSVGKLGLECRLGR